MFKLTKGYVKIVQLVMGTEILYAGCTDNGLESQFYFVVDKIFYSLRERSVNGRKKCLVHTYLHVHPVLLFTREDKDS